MVSFDQAVTQGHVAGTAQAGEVFTWAPEAVGLNGETFTADALHFADYDLIVQDPDSATFTEAGYLPITGFSLAGQPVTSAGLNDPDGTGWGAYMRITGNGTATVSPSGTPGAVYDELSYEIVGFNGSATYAFDMDGNVVVGGTVRDAVVLVSGSLISGNIDFVPTSPTELTIEGTVSLTVDEVAPGFAAGRLDVLNLSIVHPPEDYSFTSPTTTRVAATSGTDGTFAAAAAAPGSVSLLPSGADPLDWNAIAARVTSAFKETGEWYDPNNPMLFDEPVDWNTVAMQVRQNCLETGQWHY